MGVRGLATVAILGLAACGSPAGSLAQPSSTAPTAVRCVNGRPQSEIDAGKLPLHPRSAQIACVLRIDQGDATYQLTDGRALHIYERAGGLPVKPSAAPDASGTRNVAGHSWSWLTVHGQTVLYTTMPDNTYVELGVQAGSDVQRDLALLDEISRTLS